MKDDKWRKFSEWTKSKNQNANNNSSKNKSNEKFINSENNNDLDSSVEVKAKKIAAQGFEKKYGIKLPTDGKYGARDVVESSASAGLIYIGVPPSVASKISKKIIPIISATTAFILLITISVIGGVVMGSNNDPIARNASFEEIDPQIRNVVLKYANAYNVPSRVLLGIAGVQTNYGRYSPYDSIDRNPNSKSQGLVDKNEQPISGRVSTYKIVRPSIGDPKNVSQGLGMYLVQSGASIRERINAQDVEETTQWLAKLMRLEADLLVDSGVKEPVIKKDGSYIQVDEFWGQVVAALPLVDPLSENIVCAAPSGIEEIGSIITTIWNCEIGFRSNISIPKVTGTDELVVSYKKDRQLRSKIVHEALSVAWQWGKSKNSNIKNWKDLTALPCNKNSSLAGVFPITKQTASILGIKDRCNNEDVIRKVAKGVLDGLVEPINLPILNNKYPYEIEQTGWSIMPWALGSSELSEKFKLFGPTTQFIPTESCRKLIFDSLNSIALNTVLREPFLEINENRSESPENVSGYGKAVEVVQGNGIGSPRLDIRCGGKNMNIPITDWYEAVAYEADKLNILLLESNKNLSTTEPFEANTMAGIAILARYALSKEIRSKRLAVPGVDAAIERLSPNQIIIEIPESVTFGFSNNFGLWQRVITETIRLGGIIPGDERAGTGYIFSTNGGLGIAIKRENPTNKPILPNEDGTIPVPSCGVNANIFHRAVEQYVQRWISLCTNAESSGVNLSITSSWRSNAEQEYLYKVYGPGRVAAPGYSNHQRGWAMDISMEEGRSLSKNSAFAYLHSISGCYDQKNNYFMPFKNSVSVEEYVSKLDANKSLCANNLIPIKRMQTFGLVPLCTLGNGADWGDRDVLLCSPDTYISGTDQIREPWHLDFGIVLLSISNEGMETGSFDCNNILPIDPMNAQSIAVSVKTIWMCELHSLGLGNVSTINGPNYPANKYFKNLAEQVSSEAVLIAYCESSFKSLDKSGSFNGVFSISDKDMKLYGAGYPKNDLRANITAASRYFFDNWKGNNGKGWAGWGPWASVNTNNYKTNYGIKIPAIGRFASTHPDAIGEYGADLPLWAIDPTENWGPVGTCGEYAYIGKMWPNPNK
jgi:hypothetical protein